MAHVPEIKIFVSSPGDVQQERDSVFEIIEKLTRDPFIRGHVTLRGIGWDRPDSRVPMTAWRTPQAAIDEGMPTPADCEIVLVIFWMRIGTLMPEAYQKQDGSRYQSGTEYEYFTAKDAVLRSKSKPPQPQLIVYRRPEIPLDRRAPDYKEKIEQLERLDAFFAQYRAADGSLEGGVNPYAEPADFRVKVENDLRYLIKQFIDTWAKAQRSVVADTPKPDALTDDLIQTYLEEEIEAQVESVRALYVGQTGQSTLFKADRRRNDLAEAIDPMARVRARQAERAQREAIMDAGRVKLDARYCKADATELEQVADVYAKLKAIPRGVLLGEPGSGKTFTLSRLCLAYADDWLDSDPKARAKDPAQYPIPVFVRLSKYRGETAEGQPQTFADFVLAQLGVLAPHADQLIREKRLIFLCDALNEMPRGADDRNVIAVRDYLKDKTRFLISCRVRDYNGHDLDPLKPLEQVTLQELDLPRIHELIHKRLPDLGADLWKAMGGNDDLIAFWDQVLANNELARFWDSNAGAPRYTSGDQDRAWRAMHSGARLIPLCRNPFMAFLLCDIYEQRQGTLPGSRAALFGEFADTRLDYEEINAAAVGRAWPPDGIERIKAALIPVANAMQTAKSTTLTRADAIAAARSAVSDQAEWAIDSAIAASLLSQDGSGDSALLRFTHQLLQEYFAARVLIEAMEADEATGINTADRFFHDHGGAGWWDAGVWRETTVMLGEFLGEGAIGPNRVARWLAPASPEVALDVILRNGEGLTIADLEPETRSALIAGAKAKTTEPIPVGRASAYRILGVLNADDRKGIGLDPTTGLPDIDWVTIPAGEFIMGSDDDSNNPKHVERSIIQPYQISRYPITYAQYKAFLDTKDGYHDSKWWEGLHPGALNRRAEQPDQQYWPIGNHPAEGISWYDAMAFCAWLSAKLGYTVTLPTEIQWEKAARGTDGREYPYRGEFDPAKGNTKETGIGQTSAVGIFPDGASPYGILDLSGNVWEWCLNEYRSGESENISSESSRALRGGSWRYNPINARAAYRDYDAPGLRRFYFGFRVAVGAAPVV